MLEMVEGEGGGGKGWVIEKESRLLGKVGR